ncbi:S-layer homology domain-containing protein [Paenibacillus sp. 453mf]|uniref:S-layer homology domain-containing protein n=1 Tax=Paenibacillus sp. 453mf TaxID=1761874 RepID=UPI0008F07DE2|nr:S-layer homology domain-containing protein [Paenibacillus sp. 453mf]SFS96131.1 S-layer homology domain-containing protein [Paenibacillus sp. 453mf]
MRRMKTIVTGLMTVSLAFTAGAALTYADAGFSDVRSIHGEAEILSLQERNIVRGTGNREFKPEFSLSTAEAVQLIARCLESIPYVKQIPADKQGALKVMGEAYGSYSEEWLEGWYADAVQEVSNNGLMVPAELTPSTSITKEQYTALLVEMIENYAGLPLINIKPVEISDADSITPSYQGAIQRSLIWDITSLDDKLSFSPRSEITRAEASVMLFNALEFLNKHPYRQ